MLKTAQPCWWIYTYELHILSCLSEMDILSYTLEVGQVPNVLLLVCSIKQYLWKWYCYFTVHSIGLKLGRYDNQILELPSMTAVFSVFRCCYVSFTVLCTTYLNLHRLVFCSCLWHGSSIVSLTSSCEVHMVLC